MSSGPTPRLRIAVMSRAFVSTGGGAERYAIALVEALAPRHEVHVFAQSIEHSFPGVTYHRLPGAIRRPRWLNQLGFAITSWWATRQGFDIVHSHEMTWHGNVQTVHVVPLKHSLLQGRTGLAFALRVLKIATSPRLLCYWLLERARYRALPARRVVATSNNVQRVMLQSYPQVEAYMDVLTPGVAMVPGRASQADRASARALLGLPLVGHCILFVANDFQKKGLPTLLDAMKQLPQECYLAVVGGAPHVSEFRTRAQSMGLAERVFFLGPQADMEPAYRSADCLAHPTLEDTFAMVVLEAMAHGLPVAVSDRRYCGIAELLTDGHDALVLADPKDRVALAQALRQLLEPGPLSESLAAAGIAFAESHQWSEIAARQEAIYQRLVIAPPRP